jgi:hypothetical protein
VTTDGVVLTHTDVTMPLDTPDAPIVQTDVVEDDANVAIDVPDVPPPMDVPPDVPPDDVPPPMDVPVPTDAPVDLPDVPLPLDVVVTTAAGDPCTTATVCEPASQCFSFGSTSFCERCGGYGERACAGRMCREGTYNATSDSCIHSPGTHNGSPGGSCSRSSDCGSLGQCFPIGLNSVCLECGDVGEACCCPDGSAGSCACNGSATCTLNSSGTGWTVCN